MQQNAVRDIVIRFREIADIDKKNVKPLRCEVYSIKVGVSKYGRVCRREDSVMCEV